MSSSRSNSLSSPPPPPREGRRRKKLRMVRHAAPPTHSGQVGSSPQPAASPQQGFSGDASPPRSSSGRQPSVKGNSSPPASASTSSTVLRAQPSTQLTTATAPAMSPNLRAGRNLPVLQQKVATPGPSARTPNQQGSFKRYGSSLSQQSSGSSAHSKVSPETKQPKAGKNWKDETIIDIVLLAHPASSDAPSHIRLSRQREAHLSKNGIAGHTVATYKKAYEFGYLDKFPETNYNTFVAQMKPVGKPDPSIYRELQAKLDALELSPNERPSLTAIAAAKAKIPLLDTTKRSGIRGPCGQVLFEKFFKAIVPKRGDVWDEGELEAIKTTPGFVDFHGDTMVLGYTCETWRDALDKKLEALQRPRKIKLVSIYVHWNDASRVDLAALKAAMIKWTTETNTSSATCKAT